MGKCELTEQSSRKKVYCLFREDPLNYSFCFIVLILPIFDLNLVVWNCIRKLRINWETHVLFIVICLYIRVSDIKILKGIHLDLDCKVRANLRMNIFSDYIGVLLILTYNIANSGVGGNTDALGSYLLTRILKVESHDAMKF